MYPTTGDHTLIKKINTAIVLETVIKGSPLSRAQISERAGLNKATVSNLVQDLIDSHLIVEIGMGVSRGGRKPIMLLFNGKAGYAVGIDLGVNYIRGVLIDLEGNVIAQTETVMKRHDVDDVLPALFQIIESLIAQAPECPYGLVGIGIGVAGIVDSSGTVLFAPNLQWRMVPLQEIVTARFNVQVTIDNEANAGALGEQRYGAGRGFSEQVYVSVGIGIGAGLIMDAKLYRGASGFSGELGHLSIELNGPTCRCRNRGCWELYASENALLEQAGQLGYDDLEELLHAAEEGNEIVINLLRRIGEYLGVGIANIVNVFNPEVVIIGNRMCLAAPWIGDVMRETIASRTLPYHRRAMRILFAELKEQSAVRGAAFYAIESFFDRVKGGA